jgi:uncharacterized membrane protein
VQPESWFTVYVWPAIVAVPLRGGSLFAWTSIRTWPLPLPDAPDVTVSQGTWLAAVQAQPAALVTSTVSVLAVAGAPCEAGAML